MHSHFTVIYDACVLYPAMLRNLLMQLTTTEMFRARWTEQIHEEWMTNLLGQRPDLERDQLDRTRAAMDRVVPDCLVTEYDPLIEGLELPDPNDRHVLAAAIRCNADAIITINLKDFPDESLKPYGIEAQQLREFSSIVTRRAQLRQSMRSKKSSAGVIRWQNLTKTEQESNASASGSNQHNPLPYHDLTTKDNTRHLAAPGV